MFALGNTKYAQPLEDDSNMVHFTNATVADICGVENMITFPIFYTSTVCSSRMCQTMCKGSFKFELKSYSAFAKATLIGLLFSPKLTK